MKNKIKVLRMQFGITQEHLATKIEISRPALSDIENSKVVPGGKTVIRMAHFFGIPAEQIFFEDTVMQGEQGAEEPAKGVREV